MTKLTLMVGLPGSGKSTVVRDKVFALAERTQGQSRTVSADKFWGPYYEFDIKYIKYAHLWCQGLCAKHMFDKIEDIFVDNTNLKAKDRQHYVDLAAKFGYTVVYHVMDEWDVDVCFERNTHGVPREVIENMKKGYEAP